MRVRWRSLVGFDADTVVVGSDGRWRHVLEVRTTRGMLRFIASAEVVSVVMQEVGGRSDRWRRARRPLRLTMAAAVSDAAAVSPRSGAAPPGRSSGWPCEHGSRGVGPPRPAVHDRADRRSGPASSPAGRVARGHGHGGEHGRRVGLRRGARVRGAACFTPADGATQPGLDTSSMGRIEQALRNGIATSSFSLPEATAPPAPTPPSLAGAPPLRPHEVFGFAPYWTLPQSAGFDVTAMTTLAYFSIDVNADGSLDESGPGWNGYQSQALANLITRAHAAGRPRGPHGHLLRPGLARPADRLRPPLRRHWLGGLIAAIEAKNLDGVNIDFEGQGSRDQAGLTNLVARCLRGGPPGQPPLPGHDGHLRQLGRRPRRLLRHPALAPPVDAFFVMAYQLNLQSPPVSRLAAHQRRCSATRPPSSSTRPLSRPPR